MQALVKEHTCYHGVISQGADQDFFDSNSPRPQGQQSGTALGIGAPHHVTLSGNEGSGEVGGSGDLQGFIPWVGPHPRFFAPLKNDMGVCPYGRDMHLQWGGGSSVYKLGVLWVE